MIYPLPAVIVTCGDAKMSNMLTVAWTGILCTDPAMCYISVRPSRHSYGIIKEKMEFTINLTTAAMARATDLVGVTSGADHDKWAESGLTPEPGVNVECPCIKESPVAVECRVKDIVSLGTHDMFVADILDIRADQGLLDPETGEFDLAAAGLMSYSHGKYYEQGPEIGHFGWSVRKKEK